MSKIHIIIGSMLGGTEYVAEAAASVFDEHNLENQLHFQPNLAEIETTNSTWLICTSTHGAGDLPDNIKDFVDQLDQCEQDLSTIAFATIATGDSSYDTFCQAAKTINTLLISKGCIEKIETLYIDMQQDLDPEEEAENWIRSHIQHF